MEWTCFSSLLCCCGMTILQGTICSHCGSKFFPVRVPSRFWEQVVAMDGLDDFRVNVLFNSISVISGRLLDDNEKLSATEPRHGWRDFRLKRVLNPGPPDR